MKHSAKFPFSIPTCSLPPFFSLYISDTMRNSMRGPHRRFQLPPGLVKPCWGYWTQTLALGWWETVACCTFITNPFRWHIQYEVGFMSHEGQDLHSTANQNKYHYPHNKLTPVSSNNHMEVIQYKKLIWVKQRILAGFPQHGPGKQMLTVVLKKSHVVPGILWEAV